MQRLLFGVEDELSQKMLEYWLIGAVARAVDPGCQFDQVLVLKSAQGTGKTSFFRLLAGEYFVTIKSDVTSTETARLLRKGWIGELGEMEGITRKADVEALKDFITRTKDDIRKMFTEDIPEYPRHIVFGGSCNSDEILRDRTGNRRFTIIPFDRKVDLEWLEANRDRIWYSAYQLYTHHNSKKTQWWIPDDLVAQSETRNQDFKEQSPFENPTLELIQALEANYLTDGYDSIEFTLETFLEAGLNIVKEHQRSQHKNILPLLKYLGFDNTHRAFVNGSKITRWRKPNKTQYRPLTFKEIFEVRRTL